MLCTDSLRSIRSQPPARMTPSNNDADKNVATNKVLHVEHSRILGLSAGRNVERMRVMDFVTVVDGQMNRTTATIAARWRRSKHKSNENCIALAKDMYVLLNMQDQLVHTTTNSIPPDNHTSSSAANDQLQKAGISAFLAESIINEGYFPVPCPSPEFVSTPGTRWSMPTPFQVNKSAGVGANIASRSRSSGWRSPNTAMIVCTVLVVQAPGQNAVIFAKTLQGQSSVRH